MNIEIIINILTALFGALMFNMMISAFLEKRDNIPGWIYSVSVFFLAVLIYLSNTYFAYAMLNIIITIALIFLMSLLYYGSMKNRVLVSIFSSLIMTIIEIAVMFMIILVFNITAEEAVRNFGLRLLGIVVSKMISFAVFKLLCINAKGRNTAFLEPSYWILFILILLTSLFAVSVISIPQVTNTPRADILTVICSFGLLFSSFFSMYLYEHMSQQAEELTNEKLAKERAVEREKHLKELLLAQGQLRTLRHDLSNHMISLRSYFETKDFRRGIDYINSIENIMIGNRIIDTGNASLDAIVNIKTSIAESKGIEFKTNIQIPENVGIDDIDISAILGNALDNAIEACEKIQNCKKYIWLTMIYDESSIVCKVENSAPVIHNTLLNTTKDDAQNHGLGIKSIKAIVKKYKGVYNIEHSNNKFVLSFVIREKG